MAELPVGTVTFLFTDIEGSTRLWQEHPEAMKRALARHDEIVRDAIAGGGGHVVKTTGDGVHGVFSDAASAVRAAVDAQRALDAETWGETGPLRVRIGLHTGLAEQRDGDYFGTAVNRAARLMGAAHGEQIVVSLTTEELLREAAPEVELIDLGAHRLRDLSVAERIFQVAGSGLRREFPPLRSIDAYRGNLPVQTTSFVGRDAELVAVANALQEARVVTVVGAGGVGKTRLALHVAADLVPQFTDGAWLCELAGAADGGSLNELVAATLGVAAAGGMSLDDGIAKFLQEKRLLLVLDNCEHLLDAVGALVTAVIRQCPDVRILTTSREALGIAGEQIWPLRSLSVGADSDAVQLFVERSRSVKPTFVLDSTNAEAVGEICRRLDGLPLAIELAAARVASMTPREIADRLDERFRLLTGGRRSAVERHQTLRATVEWSYSLLSERDRLVFDRLGVFVGGFDTEGAIAVAAGDAVEEWDVVDAVADLVAKSLLSSEETTDATTRYEVLETLRHYARERLDDHADADTRRRLHASYFAGFAERAGRGVAGPDELIWRARIRAELDNLRAALTWSLDAADDADAEFGVRIVVGLAVQQGYDPALGIGDWALRAMARDASTTPARRQIVRAAAAYRLALAGDFERARELAVDALRGGVPDDSPWPSYAAYARAFAAIGAGDEETAVETCERALEEVGDRTGPMGLVTLHAVAAGASGAAMDFARARAHAERAVEHGRQAGCPSGLSSSLFAYGATVRSQDPSAARQALEQSVEWVQRGGSPVVYGYALAALAWLRAQAGEHVQAMQALHEALRYATETANTALTAMICFHAVPVLAEMGAFEAGVTVVPSSWVPWVSTPETEAALERARTELGDDRFARARARAESMTMKEQRAYALAELDRLIAELDDV